MAWFTTDGPANNDTFIMSLATVSLSSIKKMHALFCTFFSGFASAKIIEIG